MQLGCVCTGENNISNSSWIGSAGNFLFVIYNVREDYVRGCVAGYRAAIQSAGWLEFTGKCDD